ncbi:MAG TPA: uroporphyrinogen decarboxylase family protein [Armatimonadota bacterium]|jgi:uroporphyrinogen decarboxylase
MADSVLQGSVQPDWEAFLACLLRPDTPRRVHFIELFLDWEVQEQVCRRFGLLDGMDSADPDFALRRELAIQRFLGYDYVRCGLWGMDWPMNRETTADTAELGRSGGRTYINEHRGPITTWAEFEAYPWPDPSKASTYALEWYQKRLPDDMCLIGSGGFAHFAEHLVWLMGYEELCYALKDNRDLVRAISDRLIDIFKDVVRLLLQFDRVKVVWGSDDLGFRSATLISPADLREFVLPGHRLMAQMSHDAGRPYLLHSCGNLEAILGDLLDDVCIDGKHSFEDTVELVTDAKARYGDRIALLGGLDVDFLCRASEAQVRDRVRHTLAVCQPGGRYCLGTGNSVANYIPLNNYLAMLDEGRAWQG